MLKSEGLLGMHLEMDKLDSLQVYRLMTQTIIPRPIAWVLSENAPAGTYNLAPFSYFNIVNNDPALVSLSIGRKNDDSIKDTRANIERGGDFVIHIPSSKHATMVTASSSPLPYGESEIDALGLSLVHDLKLTKLPRIEGVSLAFFCQMERLISIGREDHALIIAYIKSMYIDDNLATDWEKSGISATTLDPLGRLGGNDYCTLGQLINIPRPDYRP